LRASAALGVAWASVHLPYFLAAGAPMDWVAWQFAYLVATRVVFVWVYNNTGRSLFAVAVMHTLFNQVWQLFPRDEALAGMSVPTFYNPASLALTTIALAATVTALWGPSTLARFRIGRSGRPATAAVQP
jgi:hypothetical protein